MRVAVVAQRTARHDGWTGPSRLSELATALADRGHDVTVFCSQWWDGGIQEPNFEVDDVQYRAVTFSSDPPDYRFGRRLPPLIRRVEPDVIHTAHEPPLGVLGASLAGSLTRTPLVVDWYDDTPRNGWHEWVRRLAARWPDRVITPSQLSRTELIALGRPKGTTEIVPSSVDMATIRALEPESAGEVVYSRRLDGDANLENLLLALAELRTVEWSGVVLGEGSERAKYETQAADLRIDDRVTFLDNVSRDRRLAIFKGAHVAVHTATDAPFAREFLRALACGCVGIAEYHTDSSAHELIERRERGMGVTDEQGLADAIREAADMPHKTVEPDFESFDDTEILERYLACYREVQSEYGML